MEPERKLVSVFQVDLTDKSPEAALNEVSAASGYYFAYEVNMPALLNRSAFRYHDKISITDLMEAMTADTPLRYFILKDQVILQPAPQKKSTAYLIGKIVDDSTKVVIPYATVEIKSRNIGVVADFRGRFKLSLKELLPADTLLVSSMGYQKRFFLPAELVTGDSMIVQLQERTFMQREVKVEDSRYVSQSLGVRSAKSQGETYVDTHGQQTALFFNNDAGWTGKIEKIRYFLSPKGNTHAPFRVHIYAPATAGNGPGDDLITSFLVVKPDIIRGWYEVDVFEFEIDIPEGGFYVALEGVFPNNPGELMQSIDQQALKGPGLKKRKDQMIRLLSYGQRIGFRKSRENLTWHYSLSGTWFQLERQSFNVMMGAQLLVEPQKDDDE